MKKNSEDKVKIEFETDRATAYIINDIAARTNQNKSQVINDFVKACIKNLIESANDKKQ